jgi:hypothetical protein
MNFEESTGEVHTKHNKQYSLSCRCTRSKGNLPLLSVTRNSNPPFLLWFPNGLESGQTVPWRPCNAEAP